MSLIGKEVQPFAAKAYKNGEFIDVTHEDLKGQWSIFCFYPADFSFVCPTELEDLQNHYEALKELGVEVYSVSTDTHFVHKGWHDSSEKIGKITYAMIGDPSQTISRNLKC
ncbi:Peroxiredoxin [Bacillus licheniformis]|nr:Peroxiredoxin [Bacillus licheniformis]